MLTNVRFSKSILGFPKMDIYKCPFFISWKRIWSKNRKNAMWDPQPHNHPQPTNGTLSSSLSFKKETIYSWILIPGNADTKTFCLFVRPSPSLFYTRSREKIPLSWESRNEWQIEIWVTTILAHLHHTLRLLFSYIFSLQLSFKRENYTHIIPPFWELQKWVTNRDMSRKSF